MQHKTLVMTSLLAMVTLGWISADELMEHAKHIGKLYDPVGRVEVMHDGKIYAARDNFRIYLDDIIYLYDTNDSARLILYENGSILYPLNGNTVFKVREYVFVDNKPNTTNIIIKSDNRNGIPNQEQNWLQKLPMSETDHFSDKHYGPTSK
ncbi:MAG: hypothetical protein JXK05_08185 [Campylobacterales bacterium]|nr:hypothetical protein [Campylobacterales bacterium]